MRKTLLLAVMLAATSLIWAQDAQENQQGPPPGQGMRHVGPASPAEHAKHLTKELGLNAEQSAKIQQIFADQQKKHEAQMQDAENLSPEERRANFMQARQDVDSQIEALLTDAQKTKFKQMLSRKKEGRRGGHPPDGDQSPPPDQQ